MPNNGEIRNFSPVEIPEGVCERGQRLREWERESTLKCLTDERKGSLLVTNRRRVNKALDGGGCASRGVGAKNLTENPSRLAPSEVRGAFRSVPALHSTSILLLLIFPPLHLAFPLRSGRRMRSERHCHNSNSVSLRVLGFCSTATQESLIQMSLLWVGHGPKCHCGPVGTKKVSQAIWEIFYWINVMFFNKDLEKLM